MASLLRLARSVMARRRSLARFICVSPGFDNVWVAASMRLAPPVPETGAMRDIAICVRPRAHLRWLRARGSIEKYVGTACRRGRGGHAPAQRAGPRGIDGPRRTHPVVHPRVRATAPANGRAA